MFKTATLMPLRGCHPFSLLFYSFISSLGILLIPGYMEGWRMMLDGRMFSLIYFSVNFGDCDASQSLTQSS